MLTLDQALDVIKALIRRSQAQNAPLGSTLILVGGTALAAHGVRDLSEDVDVFVRTFSAEVVHQVECERRAEFGAGFKLDVTQTENLWGSILVRDIDAAASTLVQAYESRGERYEIRALDLETLFLLKLAAGRQRDRDDLPLLASKTGVDKLVGRFNTLLKWYGDSHGIVVFADDFVEQLCALYGCDAMEIIARLGVPDFVKEMLCEARKTEPVTS